MGHHWVPFKSLKPYWDRLSESAKDVAARYYSGPLTEPHGRFCYGGVKHVEYENLVEKEFGEFLEKQVEAGKKVSDLQMKQFAERMRNGESYLKNGEKLKKFNEGILGLCKEKPRELDLKALRREGRNYRSETGRYMAIAGLGAIFGVLMKGEEMPPNAIWGGNPAKKMREHSGDLQVRKISIDDNHAAVLVRGD